MRRFMVLLSLTAAFAGTPLRLTEAAGDLAHLLAELVDDGGIETIDGGVGDDSGETIRPAPAHALTVAGLTDIEPATFLLAECRTGVLTRPFPSPPAASPTTAQAQCALLQRFLC